MLSQFVIFLTKLICVYDVITYVYICSLLLQLNFVLLSFVHLLMKFSLEESAVATMKESKVCGTFSWSRFV